MLDRGDYSEVIVAKLVSEYALLPTHLSLLSEDDTVFGDQEESLHQFDLPRQLQQCGTKKLQNLH